MEKYSVILKRQNMQQQRESHFHFCLHAKRLLLYDFQMIIQYIESVAQDTLRIKN